MSSPQQTAVVIDIAEERERQDRKWGPQNHDDARWFLILAEEFGELAREVNEEVFRPTSERLATLRQELVQTAAVCVAWLECLERRHTPDRWRRGS